MKKLDHPELMKIGIRNSNPAIYQEIKEIDKEIEKLKKENFFEQLLGIIRIRKRLKYQKSRLYISILLLSQDMPWL